MFNNFTGLLRVHDRNIWLPRYVFYSLFSNYLMGGTRAYENRTTGLHNLQTDSYISSFEVRPVSIEKQVEICSKLDKIIHMISLKKKQISKLDQLVKYRFVEMFGDMLINPLHWPEQRLETVAEIVSGITKGRKIQTTELHDVPYMAVSNVKDGYIDWTTVKTIAASQMEIEQYRLLPDDVLMTEGGDPDKLGRGAIIHNPPKNCIHQNHIFRVRLNQEHVLPEFMEQYL